MPTLSVSDARRLLGLPDDPGAPLPDAFTLRKAYVRAIKRDGPESNPEAFQLVRAAYELLESQRTRGDWGDDGDEEDYAASREEEPAVSAEPAPEDSSSSDALPPEETLAELTAILTDAGVMEDGVRPNAPISDTARWRVRWLLQSGWPEELDQPLVRFAARLYELGHTYEGHLVLQRLVEAMDEPSAGRGAYSDA
jgi:curved DNA-binding protein CbpA